MTNQPETLQHSINTDFSPYGLDMPYRIIVGNNPVMFVDPEGKWIMPAIKIVIGLAGIYSTYKTYKHIEKASDIAEEQRKKMEELYNEIEKGVPDTQLADRLDIEVDKLTRDSLKEFRKAVKNATGIPGTSTCPP